MGTWTVGDPTWEKQGTGGALLAQVAQTKSCWSSVGRSGRWESSRGEGDIPRVPAAREPGDGQLVAALVALRGK